MLAHVAEHGFLISQEVRSMVHRAEVAEGLQGAGMTGAGGAIDKKSVNRLMNLCDVTKQARNVQMTLSTFTGESRQVGELAVLGVWDRSCAAAACWRYEQQVLSPLPAPLLWHV